MIVIGGGIAGLQASIDLAKLGFKVHLVEKEPSIGGHIAQLSKLYPTLDNAIGILEPKMNEVAKNPNVELLTLSKVKEVRGSAGSFSVKILKNPRLVDEEKCTNCGKCALECPVSVPNEFELGLTLRKAIYVPFPQAVPRVHTIDRQNCLHFSEASCSICEEICPEKAVNYDQQPCEINLEGSAIVAATGFDIYDATKKPEFGYGVYRNVVTNLEYERLSNASEILRPSDHQRPRSVAFILCVGSRDETTNPYCCRIGCSTALKQAYSLKKRYGSEVDAYICYTDLRASGKGFEEFSRKAKGEGITLIHGQPSEIRQLPNGSLAFDAYDIATNKLLHIEADLVVLEVGLVPRSDAKDIQKLLKIPVGSDGFFLEAQPKINQVETAVKGIFLAGTAQGPKDIAETILHARTAAMAVTALMLDVVE